MPAPVPSSNAPLESVAKLVGLPTGSFPSFVFYATHLPCTIGRGAPHVRLWAHGDHAMVTEDTNVSRVHASIEFEPLSRTYELRVLGKRGALVDGHACVSGSAMRLGSGSCVRIGEAEFCVLLPLAAPQGQPRPVHRGLPLPPLPHAGSELPPQLTLQQLAAHALVRQGGPAALFRGWVPLWARFLPSSFLTFHIFEQTRRVLMGGYLD